MAEKKILHFDGLYGDLSYRKKEGYIFLELIKTRSEGFDWKIKPHIHSQLYQVFCIESGEVQLQTSDATLLIKPPAIMVIPSGTVHGLQYNPLVKGYILTISDIIFEAIFSASISVTVFYESIKIASFASQKNEFKILMRLIEQVNIELFSQELEKKILIESLLQQFFILVKRYSEVINADTIVDTNQTLIYYRSFIRLLKLETQPSSIPTYAKQIGISAVHLNRVCQRVCKKSAKVIVQELLIEKSKNYLMHTNNSIAEIAYSLHFEYPNYFARLFKKLNGFSPKEFRKTKR